jgi:hypothetical protein
MIKKRNINKLDKNIVMMKSINKRLMKEREQEHDLDLKTKMPKCMTNASFYKLKFGTIDLMTNY